MVLDKIKQENDIKALSKEELPVQPVNKIQFFF